MPHAPAPDEDLAAALGSLVTANTAVAAAQTQHGGAIERVLTQVRRLRAEAESANAPQFVAVLRHVYWQHLTVPSRDLTAAAGLRSTAELTATVGPVQSGLMCDGCGQEMMRTSRSWEASLRHYPAGFRLCKPCSERRTGERHREWEISSARRAHVDTAPVPARGRDWLVPVTLVLAYPPVTVGWDTEMIERSGLWRGYDVAQQIHELLAGYGRDEQVQVQSGAAVTLLRAANEVTDWDPDRSLDLVEQVTDESPTVILERLGRAVHQIREARQRQAQDLFPDHHDGDRNRVAVI